MMDLAKDLPEIGHIGYVVDNVDERAERLRRTFGTDSFRVYDYVPSRARVDGKDVAGCTLRICIGVMKAPPKIELIQPVQGATPHALFLREKGPGLHHLAFYVAQYDEWHDYFSAEGGDISFEAEAEDDVNGYRRSFYVDIPGMAGLFEFTEIAKKRR
jgi:methylmalonyl-CoA/ethylmalonyl-CoA epimerase